MKIGVMAESFRAGLEGGLKAAAELGAQGVQIYARHGKTDLCNLNAAERSALKRRIGDAGLELAAVVGGMGGYGLERQEDNARHVDHLKGAMELALELGCKVLTDHIGVVPSEPSHPRHAVMAGALERIGRYAESVGASFAIETGPEPAEVLRGLLDDLGMQRSVGVNFDPANLVMVFGADVVQAVRALGPYIVHTHAKDGVNLQPVDAEVLYHAFAEGGIKGFHAGDYLREVPLGEGGVHFETYLDALSEAGYDGYLTIEREVGDNPRKDIEQAAAFLRELLAARA